MAKFLYAYKGGSMAETEEERKAAMDEWGAWFGELGSAITDPGNPISGTRVVTDGGVSDGGEVSGYTLIEAESLDAAAELARGCPVLKRGGSVEVGEAVPM